MSLTPSMPDLSKYTPKSFWSKPEGKPGIILLLAIIGAGTFWAWGTIIPFILTTLADTFWAGVYLTALAVFVDILFGLEPAGRTLHTTIKNVFQSVARMIARTYTRVDPIGILENKVDDMEDAQKELNSCIAKEAGAKEKLESAIFRKKTEIGQNLRKAAEVDKELASGVDGRGVSITDDIKRKLSLNKKTYESSVSMIQGTVDRLAHQLEIITRLYNQLIRYSDYGDFNITIAKNQVENWKFEKETTDVSFSAYKAAMRVIKGDSEQERMAKMAIEALSDDIERKTGEMKDFAREADKYLTDMDVEQGAAAAEGEALLKEYEQKLLASGHSSTVLDYTQNSRGVYEQPVAVPRALPKSDSDYSDLFSK